MKIFNQNISISKILSLFVSLLIFSVFFLSSANVKAADDLSPSEQAAKDNAIAGMVSRQMDADQAYANVKDRIDAMIKNDPRRDQAKDALSAAENAKDDFKNLLPDDNLLTDPFRPNDAFNSAEKKALNAISDVNKKLLAPERPGNVPEGDIITDFIPGLIRMLFRFASLAVFVAFIVSGVMFVIAFGEEARITKAKNILYYTLIGFAFITLAFAVVKAVTNIDFFGFI